MKCSVVQNFPRWTYFGSIPKVGANAVMSCYDWFSAVMSGAVKCRNSRNGCIGVRFIGRELVRVECGSVKQRKVT